jgi:hypothetical protein
MRPPNETAQIARKTFPCAEIISGLGNSADFVVFGRRLYVSLVSSAPTSRSELVLFWLPPTKNPGGARTDRRGLRLTSQMLGGVCTSAAIKA